MSTRTARAPTAPPQAKCVSALRLSTRLAAVLVATLATLTILVVPLRAEVVLDGTMGSTLSLGSGPSYTIPETVGQKVIGTSTVNLFHSFDKFNLKQGERATFTATGTVTNIVARVIGGQSVIDGRINSTLSNTNLYLINRDGIIFGPHSSLTIRGSFYASTADYLKFADGVVFSADPAKDATRPPPLTAALPEAFGFVASNPASLVSQADHSLAVRTGKTLAFVAGDISLDGAGIGQGLVALSGTVHVASVSSPGELPLRPADLNVSSFARLGTIALSNGALIDASGDGAGTVRIRSGRLVLDQQSRIESNAQGDSASAQTGIDIKVSGDVLLRNQSLLQTTTQGGSSRAGDVRVSAGNIVIDALSSISAGSAGVTGAGGDILLQVGDLTIKGLGAIDTSSKGPGQSGSVTILASGNVSISGTDGVKPSRINSLSQSPTKDAGAITISAASLSLTEGGAVFASTEKGGRGGDVLLAVGNLTLADGARITTSTESTVPGTSGGPAGNITVTASQGISLSNLGTGLFSTTRGTGGQGGNVSVRGGNISLSDRASISAVTFGSGRAGAVDVAASDTLTVTGGGQITTSSSPTIAGSSGSAGNVTVRAANTLSISGPNSGLFSTTSGSGLGGSIGVQGGNISLSNRASISAMTFGSGRAGAVDVAASDTLTVTRGGQITTSSSPAIAGASGSAGNVTVRAADTLSLSGRDSGLFSATSGGGPGGSIGVQARQVRLFDGAEISAKSSGAGNAGDITITAGDRFESFSSRVTTEATRADGGNVALTAPALVRLVDSRITATVEGGSGNGGNIAIDPDAVVLKESQIIANAFGGRGGNINIAAGVFLSDPSSVVSASSALGLSGTVDIHGQVKNISEGLTLSAEFSSAAALLRARCAARSQEGQYSTLTLAGRPAAPIEPGGVLAGPPLLAGSPRAGADFGPADTRWSTELPDKEVLTCAH